ncbi:DUF3137 domain-containing protein [Shewanella corallii]|uniref:DUF3137 domain-containing protein n=1 Tax=Shewanella corallii TaxID=560080 RepID=A0ABT0N7U9_9GAMM|nr:DUF3137 domain-containing protein [Shewanella corallii]MCL2914511.1 DUF3137 domain-containing protein [Shewanella corallii]
MKPQFKVVSHNAKVEQNIEAIRDQVSSAETQQDLETVIEKVSNHAGPLDYQDTLYRVFFGSGLVMVILSIMAMFADDSAGKVWQSPPGSVVIAAYVYLYPVLALATLGQWLEDKGYGLPVSQSARVRLGCWGVAGALFAFMPNWPQELSYTMGFSSPVTGLMLSNLVFVILMFPWLRSRANWRKPLSDKIFLLDALFNNQLKEVPFSRKEKADELYGLFREFGRGNHLREVLALYQGRYEGEQHSFDYHLYKFHYVEKKTETYTDSDGKTRTRTVKYDYYRYGIYLQFPFAKGVSFQGDGRIFLRDKTFSGTSNDFNRIYKVSTEDTMDAARMLSPLLEEALVKFGEKFSSPVIEINRYGDMCVASKDKLLVTERVNGLDNPDAFLQEISGHTELEDLKLMLDTVHEMMRLCDNNFVN